MQILLRNRASTRRKSLEARVRESIPPRMMGTAHSQTIVLAHLRKFEASCRHSLFSFRTEPLIVSQCPQQRSCTSSKRSFSPNSDKTTVSTNIRVVGSKELRRSFRARERHARTLLPRGKTTPYAPYALVLSIVNDWFLLRLRRPLSKSAPIFDLRLFGTANSTVITRQLH